MTSRPALQRCLHVSTDEFAQDFWSREPHLSTIAERSSAAIPGDRNDFADLFSLSAVDELLSQRGLRTPFIRIAKDGAVTPSSRYTRSGGTGAQVTDQVADDRVLELFLDGHTIVLQGLHRMWPPLIDFAGALASDLGHPVQVNAYVTPASSQGFSAHYDLHDVFVLQIAGEKRWRIHEPVIRDPLRDQPWAGRRAEVAARAAEAPLIDAVLRPGDALYLPRGYLHAAEALGEVSCHLTIGVHPVTRHHLLESLLAIVATEPELRGSLPMGADLADPAVIAADVHATVAALVTRLNGVSVAQVAAHLAPQLATGNRPAPIAPLAQAAALAGLTPGSVLSVRPHLRHVLEHDGGEVVIHAVDRVLRLPMSDTRAVQALLDGGRLSVSELPGLDGAEARRLAQRLVREGIAVIDDAQ